jgi:UDP-glucose 6-dehydrogenase
MNLTVIGSGYVGLVSGTCFAEMGNKVTCIDIDNNKISKLQEGVIPIYEPGLEQMVKRNIENKTLQFSTKLSDNLDKCDAAFIAVGTPMGEDGSADLKYVLGVAKEIGMHMTTPLVVADKVRNTILAELEKRKVEIDFHVVSNPEFLKEGDAINDFMKPDRVVIGSDSDNATKIMRNLYAPFFRSSTDRLITMDIRSAEMTKYVANAMLATKISFMNEIANICELVDADVNKVRIGIGSDSRIGYSFIYPGSGYGTDDMREAPAIYIIKELTKRGAKIKAYDPKAIDEAKHFYLKDVPNVEYYTSKYETLVGSDAMILLTEWKEFRSPDFEELKKQLKQHIIFDGRNQYDSEKMHANGFEYFQIGKK